MARESSACELDVTDNEGFPSETAHSLLLRGLRAHSFPGDLLEDGASDEEDRQEQRWAEDEPTGREVPPEPRVAPRQLHELGRRGEDGGGRQDARGSDDDASSARRRSRRRGRDAAVRDGLRDVCADADARLDDGRCVRHGLRHSCRAPPSDAPSNIHGFRRSYRNRPVHHSSWHRPRGSESARSALAAALTTVEMVVATHRALVARLAPRLARARLAPATGAPSPATKEPISRVSSRREGARRAVPPAPRGPSRGPPRRAPRHPHGARALRARASHRARHPRPRGVLATPLRASADGPAAAPAHPPSAREISSSAVVCYGKPAPGVNVTHQLITFFRFTELKDPNAEVEAHHAYIAENGLEIRGRHLRQRARHQRADER